MRRSVLSAFLLAVFLTGCGSTTATMTHERAGHFGAGLHAGRVAGR